MASGWWPLVWTPPRRMLALAPLGPPRPPRAVRGPRRPPRAVRANSWAPRGCRAGGARLAGSWVQPREPPSRGRGAATAAAAVRATRAASGGPLIRGGRPCGFCGRLADPEAGQFGPGQIFYCPACLGERSRAWEAARGSTDPAAWLEEPTLLHSQAEAALRRGDVGTLGGCLSRRAEIASFRGGHGRTLVHAAAEVGDARAVRQLLAAFAGHYGQHVELGQAVELYEDGFGLTAGELAFAGGHREVFDILVESACERPRPSNYCAEHNKAYVKQPLKYEGDVLLDATGGGVMMGWERPLMARHAEAIAPVPGLAVLNVGFGLGLIDGLLQDRLPQRHTIVEAHPDVRAEMRRRGWYEKPSVVVLAGRWQDAVDDMAAHGPYDGIFFDTYAEMYGDLQEFFKLLPRLLRPGGRFSFFNGLSDKNIYAQAISCRVAQLDLAALGLACLFESVPLGEVSDDEWRKVVNHYWSLATYYVPLAVMLPSGETATGASDGALWPGLRPGPRGGGGRGLRPSAVQVQDHVGKVLDDKLDLARAALRSPTPSPDDAVDVGSRAVREGDG